MDINIDMTIKNGDSIIDGEAKKFGHSSHIIVPKKYIGKKAKIIFLSKL